MATESIFANVVLREPDEVKRFVNAMEKSQLLASKTEKHPPLRIVRSLSRTETKKLLTSGKTWAGLN